MKTNSLKWVFTYSTLLSTLLFLLGYPLHPVSFQTTPSLPFCTTPSYSDTLITAPLPIQQHKSTLPLHLRLYLHIIRNEQGQNGLSMAQIAQSLRILQNAFLPFEIYFHPTNPIYYVDDQALFDDPNGTGSIIGTNDHEDGIDIYFFPDHLGHPVAGGGMSLNIPSTAFFIAGRTLEDPKLPYRRTAAIAHEMGHCLGLFHTHHGTEQGACEEWVNRTNCYTCGDFICDTPTDPGLLLQVNPTHCTWSGSAYDSQGQAMQPDLYNIMSYTHPRCMLRFTYEQGQRMRYYLQHHPLLQKCLIQQDIDNPKH